MSNSPLVVYTNWSPNHSGKRTHAIDTITPHCFVGYVDVKAGTDIFKPTKKRASCQYVIAYDGKIGQAVDEANRSWCTSSNANDQRAITIECASDDKDPYTFSGETYNSLIRLSADICQRNGKTKLLWFGDKAKTLAYKPATNEMLVTVHRWFANKACPGNWMMQHMDDYVARVNALLQSDEKSAGAAGAEASKKLYRVQVGAYGYKANADKQLKKVKDAGFDAFVVKIGNLYKIQVGAFSKKENADAMLKKVKAAGFDAFITES